MSYTRPQRFEPGAFLRTCDICGIRYRSTELVRGEDGFWRCIAYCQEVPPLTRDKIISQSQRRREAPPPPHGIPFDRKSTYAEEELVLKFLVGAFVSGNPAGLGLNTDVAAANGAYAFSGGTGFLAAGETARYCRDLIVENRRPTQWITLCTARLKAIADAIVANQIGFGTSPTSTLANDIHYGALLNPTSSTYITEEIAGCGLALLWAFQIIGTASYLVSAKAVAHYLRNVQAIGSVGTYFTSADSAGTVNLYTGGTAATVANDTHFYSSHTFYPSSMIVLEFWNALFASQGDGNYGCPNSLANCLTASASQLLSKCIGDFRAFWSVGTLDTATGTTIAGLSATTPREYFNAYPASKPGFSGIVGTGSWWFQDAGPPTGVMIQSSNFAAALRSLFAFEGYSSQVSSVWTWLMSFTGNPAFVAPSGTLASDYACASTTLAANPPAPPVGQGNIVAPSYDPTLALTTLLQVRDPVTLAATAINGSSVYDWSTTGMMAPIQSAQNAGAFRKAKDRLTAGYFRTRPDFCFSDPVREDSLLLRGYSGLAFQLSSTDVHGATE